MTTELPLSGVRVVELCSEMGAWAGRLLADFGAEVILVEPPGGHYTRQFGPFFRAQIDPERSIWFWQYNANKIGVELDVASEDGLEQLSRVLDTADILLFVEGADASIERRRLSELTALNPRLIVARISSFGCDSERALEAATDLTLLASGGAAWACGYDDHTLPPVRGGGNQAYQTAAHFAVQAILVALLERDVSGEGQDIEVNANAAVNVTTESATTNWIVAGVELARQTGRHAAASPTLPTQYLCEDGAFVNASLPGESSLGLDRIAAWLGRRKLLEEFPQSAVLEWSLNSEAGDSDDSVRSAGMEVLRHALHFLAEKSSALQFFHEAQEHGFACAPVYPPEAAMDDEHIRARGFGSEVLHEDLGQSFRYPGLPIHGIMSLQRRAPRIGEHNGRFLAAANSGERVPSD